MTTVPIDDLVASVTKGAAWLGEHDPHGAFYMWWKMKMTPSSPMPGQPEEVRAAWAKWCRAYDRWLNLYDELERRSAEDAAKVLEGVLG